MIFTLDLEYIELHGEPFDDVRHNFDGNEIGTRPGRTSIIDLLFMQRLPKTYECTKRTFTCLFSGL